MLARKPRLDLAATPRVWSRIPEFSLFNDGSSVCIPIYEHYLNNVAKEVRDRHCDGNPALAAMLDVFIRQESTHARYHAEFNRRVLADDDGRLKAITTRLAAELQALRKHRSLAYNMAFCAGFENTATFSAMYLFGADDLFEGADPNGSNLFLWHVAEEFEHRSVCHEAFGALSGRYGTRIRALAHSFRHISGTFNRATDVLLERWREGLSPAERAASIRRHRALQRRQNAFVLTRLPRLLSPWFDPARLTVPPKVAYALEHFAGDAPIGRHYNETWHDEAERHRAA